MEMADLHVTKKYNSQSHTHETLFIIVKLLIHIPEDVYITSHVMCTSQS